MVVPGKASARGRCEIASAWQRSAGLAEFFRVQVGFQVFEHVAGGGTDCPGAGQPFRIPFIPPKRGHRMALGVVPLLVPLDQPALLPGRQRHHRIAQAEGAGDLLFQEFGIVRPARAASSCPSSPKPKLLYRNGG